MKVKGFYYRDKDQAFLVSDAAVKEINKALIHNIPVDTGGYILYPIFEDPSEQDIRAGKTKKVAWQIRPNQCPTVRWYWQVQEHKKSHHSCTSLGDGLCGFKMVRFYTWNASTSKWELSPMVNHADSEQEKVLDNR